MISNSTITCPECGHKKEEVMPTDMCLFYYECKSCNKVIRAKQGDCCVFCSYGSIMCPPKQTEQNHHTKADGAKPTDQQTEQNQQTKADKTKADGATPKQTKEEHRNKKPNRG